MWKEEDLQSFEAKLMNLKIKIAECKKWVIMKGKKEIKQIQRTLWNHSTRFWGGFAVIWHSKYTSDPFIKLLGSNCDPKFRVTIGASKVSKEKSKQTYILRPKIKIKVKWKDFSFVIHRPFYHAICVYEWIKLRNSGKLTRTVVLTFHIKCSPILEENSCCPSCQWIGCHWTNHLFTIILRNRSKYHLGNGDIPIRWCLEEMMRG